MGDRPVVVVADPEANSLIRQERGAEEWLRALQVVDGEPVSTDPLPVRKSGRISDQLDLQSCVSRWNPAGRSTSAPDHAGSRALRAPAASATASNQPAWLNTDRRSRLSSTGALGSQPVVKVVSSRMERP